MKNPVMEKSAVEDFEVGDIEEEVTEVEETTMDELSGAFKGLCMYLEEKTGVEFSAKLPGCAKE